MVNATDHPGATGRSGPVERSGLDEGLEWATAERFLDVVRRRRSVRSFEPGRSLDRAALLQICEAGRWAPSGANTQPWDLVVVHEREALDRVADVFVAQADRLVEHCRGFPHVHKKHWIHDSVAIVLVFADPRWKTSYPVSDDPGWSREYDENNERILLASVGAAAQNIQLAVAALGLSSAWLSGGGEDTTASELRSALGVPEPLVPVATIPIGWPHRRSESRWRRPLEEVVHWNGWDPARTRSDDDVAHYVRTLRRKAMYRGLERMEDWPEHIAPEAEAFADRPEEGT